jgi:phage tail-like protein
MSNMLQPGYRFASEAQWSLCLFAAADRTSATARLGLRPFAPYGLPPTSLWSGTAHAPAITEEAEVIWRDEAGHLLRLPYGDAEPLSVPAPGAIRGAGRLIATPGTLWTVAGGRAQTFDDRSLTRLFEVGGEGLKVLDLASDSHDSVYLLAAEDGRVEIAHLNCAGDVESSFALSCEYDSSGIAYLGETDTIVLLASDATRLHFIDAGDGRLIRTILISALRLCFNPCIIASDGCARLFIGGADGMAVGGKNQIILTDDEANLLGVAPIEARITGLAATPSQLFATTEAGIVRFDPASVVPDGWGELSASFVTPLLQSPSKVPQKWLRAEAKTLLPQGCSLEIFCATVSTDEARQEAEAILEDASLTQDQRIQRWRGKVELQRFVYRGSSSTPAGEEIQLSAPLHDITDQFVWIQVALTAAPSGSLPYLSELAVFYPGPALIDEMPAIFRRQNPGAGDFVRALVGVLEAGTQELDGKIGELGRNISPETAGDAWLDYVASWLGLPWDNGLATDQKRRLLSRATEINDGYGTRAGLEALLESLLPEISPRFRIVDISVDYGLATIGGGGCEGSRLPAVLAGLRGSASVLGTKAVLGKARLPCGDPESDTARLLGRIRIDIAASASERQAWEPWLATLIEAVLPATTSLELRWVRRGAFDAGRVGETTTLDAQAEAHLGTDAVTGRARLSGRRRTFLPDRLTRDSTLQ